MMIRVFTTVIIISKTSSERTNTQSYNSISLRYCKRNSSTISSTRTTLYITNTIDYINRINHPIIFNIISASHFSSSITIIFSYFIMLIIKSLLNLFCSMTPISTSDWSNNSKHIVKDFIKSKYKIIKNFHNENKIKCSSSVIRRSK